jgi:hypothetical protein
MTRAYVIKCSGTIGTTASKMLQKKREDTSRPVTTVCLK